MFDRILLSPPGTLTLIVLTVAACEPASSRPAGESPTVELAPVDAAAPPRSTASAVIDPPDAADDARVSRPAPPPVSGALFVYEETTKDAISFIAPRTIVVQTSAGKTCTTELAAQGPLSAAELTKAYGDPEVQKSLGGNAVYLSSGPNLVQGELRSSAGRIAWTPFCGGLCTEGPKPVSALLGILHAITAERKKLCP